MRRPPHQYPKARIREGRLEHVEGGFGSAGTAHGHIALNTVPQRAGLPPVFRVRVRVRVRVRGVRPPKRVWVRVRRSRSGLGLRSGLVDIG